MFLLPIEIRVCRLPFLANRLITVWLIDFVRVFRVWSASSTWDHGVYPDVKAVFRLLDQVNICLTITHLGPIFVVVICFHSPRRSSHRLVLLHILKVVVATHLVINFENALCAHDFLGVHQPIFGCVISEIQALIIDIWYLLGFLVKIQRRRLIQNLLLAVKIIIFFLRNIACPRNIHPVP